MPQIPAMQMRLYAMWRPSAARVWVGLALVGSLACSSDSTGPARVEAVLITPAAVSVPSGESAQLSVQVTGRNGAVLDGRAVEWRSADSGIVAVDETGRLTARFVLGGNAASSTITATVAGVEGTAQVSVEPSVPTELTVTSAPVALAHGATEQLAVQLRDAQGNQLTGRALQWLSRDTTIARVSESGRLSTAAFLGAAARSTYVVVRLGALADSVAVSVEPTTVAELEVTPRTAYLAPSRTRRFRATAISPAGMPIPGVAVTWSSSAAGVVTVAADGVATGVGVGDALVRASVGAVEVDASVGVNACGAGPAGDYPVEVRYEVGAPTPEVQQAFTCAVARIRAAIVAPPVAPTPFTNVNAGGCSPGLILNEEVNGLLILASIVPIDGVGGVLGSAGPCYLRLEDGLPVVGRMRFDSADLNNLAQSGRLADVIIHEMLHVIGVGTVWSPKRLLIGVGASPSFTGALAQEACIVSHGGASTCAEGVPVESCAGIPGCGPGTINSHWREPIFGNELMTGYLNAGANPFSRMSIQSLADIGYGVDPDASDDYSLIPGAALQAAAEPLLPMPAPSRATHTVDRYGRLSPLPRF